MLLTIAILADINQTHSCGSSITNSILAGDPNSKHGRAGPLNSWLIYMAILSDCFTGRDVKRHTLSTFSLIGTASGLPHIRFTVITRTCQVKSCGHHGLQHWASFKESTISNHEQFSRNILFLCKMSETEVFSVGIRNLFLVILIGTN